MFNPAVSKSPQKTIKLSTPGVVSNQPARTSVKKLSVKVNTPRSPASASADFNTKALSTLTRAIRAINANPPESTPESLQALCSLSEGYISTDPHNAQTLYDKIRLELERRIGEIARILSSSSDLPATSSLLDKRSQASSAQNWLMSLDNEWQTFQHQLNMVRGVFVHLDRGYVLAHKDLFSIWYAVHQVGLVNDSLLVQGPGIGYFPTEGSRQ